LSGLSLTTADVQPGQAAKVESLSVPARYDAGLLWPLLSVKVVPDPPTASPNVLACLLPVLCSAAADLTATSSPTSFLHHSNFHSHTSLSFPTHVDFHLLTLNPPPELPIYTPKGPRRHGPKPPQ